ncbi:Coatomer subunit beta' [Stygiomarasmius scandens]|uniref:Coatomer subunit beta n=1 Tax=Marasmiellus scandens TaxID=2682957 RepID=A0ABR1IJH9_9AGAR
MKGVGVWSIDGVYGGTLLAARGNGFVMFWDWELGEIVRRIDVDSVYWSGTSNLVAIAAEDSFYILQFYRDAYDAKVEEGAEIGDEGVEEAFDLVTEVPDARLPMLHYSSVRTAKWIGNCLIYSKTSNRLSYFVGTESYTISPADLYIHIPTMATSSPLSGIPEHLTLASTFDL